MITRVDSTIENLKNLWIELFLDKTSKVSNVADGSVLNAVAFGTAKLAQKAIAEVAIVEAQIFPDYAVGEYLDKSAALFGVSPRKGALGSSTYVRVHAEPGTMYDSSIVFVNRNGIRFTVDEPLTVGDSGYGYVKVRSINSGYVMNVAPNSIITPSPAPIGHIECTNEYMAIGGRDSEDDETFRLRIKNNSNKLSQGTIEYFNQIFQDIDERILKVLNVGLDEEGYFVMYLVSQNGISFTEDELGVILDQVTPHLGIFDLNIKGEAIGIKLENAKWNYVGGDIGLDFRCEIDPLYTVTEVRQSIQIALTKYFDFRFWKSGTVIQWDDILEIVKKTEGVKYVPDEYFYPNKDIQVPPSELPRIRGFLMRDSDGVVLYDANNNLTELFYTREDIDDFKGFSDNSLSLEQSVFFTITDKDTGLPLPGVRISVNNNFVLTNNQGQATIRLTNGSYFYNITKDKYERQEGSFVVLNAPIYIETSLNPAPYTAYFTVYDTNRVPIQDAEITIDGRVYNTNIRGEADIILKNGTYNFSIVKLGYVSITGDSLTIADADLYVEKTMSFYRWNVKFIVLGEQGEFIPNAVLEIGTRSFVTDSNGEVSTTLINGNYDVRIEALSFDEFNRSITIRNRDEIFTYELTLTLYNVSFKVYGPDRITPIQGARVEVNNSFVLTNAQGLAVHSLKRGTYDYSITRDGYDDIQGSFDVIADDVEINSFMDYRHYNVVINVRNTREEIIPDAVVTVDGNVYTSDEYGQVTLSLQNGTYPYSITKLGYNDFSGSIVVNSSDTSLVPVLTDKVWDISLVFKINELFIDNVLVNINGRDYYSGVNGEVNLQMVNGTYNYTASKEGYNTKTGQITVNNQSEAFPIEMELFQYTVIFTVTGRGSTLNEAFVLIGTTEVETNEAGIAVFNLSNGIYNYTITKDDYIQQIGEISVNNQDLSKSIELIPVSHNISFNVKDSAATPNNVQGVDILINGIHLTTDASGNANMSIYSGTYTVVYSKTGYQTKTENITVSATSLNFSTTINYIYLLSFAVKSETNANLEGVEIDVEGAAIIASPKKLITDSNGRTNQIEVINGEFTYSARLDEYSPEEAVKSIQDGNLTQEITLYYGLLTTFQIKDESNNPIQNVNVLIDNIEQKSTDVNGEVSFNLSNGTHQYRVFKDGYNSQTGTVLVDNEVQTIPITLIVGSTVTYNVTDLQGAVSGALIVISQGGAEIKRGTTDTQGKYVFELEYGTYDAVISKTGYKDYKTSLVITNPTHTVNSNISNYKYYQASILVRNINDTANIVDASVVLDGQTILTGTDGYARFQVTNGNYSYTVSKTGYRMLTDSIQISNNNNSKRNLLVRVNNVIFTVNDANTSIPIQGATVVLNSVTLQTDSTGKATFTDVAEGSYSYTVSAPSPYISQTGNITVNGVDINQTVNLVSFYRISFHIVDDDGVNIDGALIKLDKPDVSGVDQKLSVQGWNSFDLQANQSFNYTVTKSGYQTQTGNTGPITEVKTINVVIPVLYAINITTKANTNTGANVPNASVNITSVSKGINQTLITGSSGQVTFNLPKSSDYAVKITATNYQEFNTTLNVTGSNSIIYALAGIYTITVNTRRISAAIPNCTVQLRKGTSVITGQTTDVNGQTIFTNVEYATDYNLLAVGQSYWADSTISFVADSNKQLTLSVTPLYDVIINTGESGLTVEVNGKPSQVTDANGSVTFTGISEGYLSYTIKDSGGNVLGSGTQNITGTGNSVTINNILPKWYDYETPGTYTLEITPDLLAKYNRASFVCVGAGGSGAANRRNNGRGGEGGSGGLTLLRNYVISNQNLYIYVGQSKTQGTVNDNRGGGGGGASGVSLSNSTTVAGIIHAGGGGGGGVGGNGDGVSSLSGSGGGGGGGGFGSGAGGSGSGVNSAPGSNGEGNAGNTINGSGGNGGKGVYDSVSGGNGGEEGYGAGVVVGGDSGTRKGGNYGGGAGGAGESGTTGGSGGGGGFYGGGVGSSVSGIYANTQGTGINLGTGSGTGSGGNNSLGTGSSGPTTDTSKYEFIGLSVAGGGYPYKIASISLKKTINKRVFDRSWSGGRAQTKGSDGAVFVILHNGDLIVENNE